MGFLYSSPRNVKYSTDEKGRVTTSVQSSQRSESIGRSTKKTQARRFGNDTATWKISSGYEKRRG